MNGSNTYQERNSVPSKGEQLFEKYCVEKGYQFFKIGLDAYRDPFPNYHKISVIIRNIPDYVVGTPNGSYVVQVKGSVNIKKKEVDMIPLLIEWYSTKEIPLIYAFCVDGKKPVVLFPEKVIELYKKAKDKKWDDGVIYRSLEI